MPKGKKAAVDYEIELAAIEDEIESLNVRVEGLNVQRNKLMIKRRQVDVAAALEYIEESGLPMDDVLELISREVSKRRCTAREKVLE